MLTVILSLISPISYSQTIIAGYPVSCNDINGYAVHTIPDPSLNDVGKAIIYNGYPTIILNPNILNNLPPNIQLFWYAHECAHHVLGHSLGNYNITSESQADCWAIKLGRQQGWINQNVLQVMIPYFRNNPGSASGHLPGPQRLQNFFGCYNS
jgi:hypothetical protein